MSDNDFKPSEVVMVISGGPRMTVTQVGEGMTGEKMVWCVWFEGNKKMEDTFPPSALKRVNEAPAGFSGTTRRG